MAVPIIRGVGQPSRQGHNQKTTMRTHSLDLSRRDSQLRQNWGDVETSALISTYEVMLALQSTGQLGPAKSKGQTSKAALVKLFMNEHAPERSKGSIETKLMNLSAVRDSLGLSIVKGYRPLPNMSTSCRQLALQFWGPAK